jgi:hypothetical protein
MQPCLRRLDSGDCRRAAALHSGATGTMKTPIEKDWEVVRTQLGTLAALCAVCLSGFLLMGPTCLQPPPEHSFGAAYPYTFQ